MSILIVSTTKYLLVYLNSVSYTHLDVYKRQHFHIPEHQESVPVERVFWTNVQMGATVQHQETIAVSYTHLDVYKRQVLASADEIVRV